MHPSDYLKHLLSLKKVKSFITKSNQILINKMTPLLSTQTSTISHQKYLNKGIKKLLTTIKTKNN